MYILMQFEKQYILMKYMNKTAIILSKHVTRTTL